jgi:hypothetical protein
MKTALETKGVIGKTGMKSMLGTILICLLARWV